MPYYICAPELGVHVGCALSINTDFQMISETARVSRIRDIYAWDVCTIYMLKLDKKKAHLGLFVGPLSV